MEICGWDTSAGSLKILKNGGLIFSAGGSPNWRHLRGGSLGVWNSNFLLFWSFSNGATSVATFIKINKIKYKMRAKWGFWNGPTSKEILRCKVGNNRSMPCGASSGEFKCSNLCFFCKRVEDWHVAPPQGGSTLPCGKMNSWLEEVFSEWRHLRRRFEILLGVGPECRESLDMWQPPQNGSYSAMWQLGENKNMWQPS